MIDLRLLCRVSSSYVRGFYFMTCFDQKSFLSQFLIIVPSYSARIFQYPIQQFIQHLPDLLSPAAFRLQSDPDRNRQFPDRKTLFFSMHSRYICSYASTYASFSARRYPLCARISARLTANNAGYCSTPILCTALRTAFPESSGLSSCQCTSRHTRSVVSLSNFSRRRIPRAISLPRAGCP